MYLPVDERWSNLFELAQVVPSEAGYFFSQSEFDTLVLILPRATNRSVTNDYLLCYNQTMKHYDGMNSSYK